MGTTVSHNYAAQDYTKWRLGVTFDTQFIMDRYHILEKSVTL